MDNYEYIIKKIDINLKLYINFKIKNIMPDNVIWI